jgi:hypothetical protein
MPPLVGQLPIQTSSALAAWCLPAAAPRSRPSRFPPRTRSEGFHTRATSVARADSIIPHKAWLFGGLVTH